MARQAKGEIQKKEPRTANHKIWVPELDEMAKNLEQTQGLKASIFQTRSQAKIVLVLKGDVDITGPKIKEIYNLLNKPQA